MSLKKSACCVIHIVSLLTFLQTTVGGRIPRRSAAALLRAKEKALRAPLTQFGVRLAPRSFAKERPWPTSDWRFPGAPGNAARPKSYMTGRHTVSQSFRESRPSLRFAATVAALAGAGVFSYPDVLKQEFWTDEFGLQLLKPATAGEKAQWLAVAFDNLTNQVVARTLSSQDTLALGLDRSSEEVAGNVPSDGGLGALSVDTQKIQEDAIFSSRERSEYPFASVFTKVDTTLGVEGDKDIELDYAGVDSAEGADAMRKRSDRQESVGLDFPMKLKLGSHVLYLTPPVALFPDQVPCRDAIHGCTPLHCSKKGLIKNMCMHTCKLPPCLVAFGEASIAGFSAFGDSRLVDGPIMKFDADVVANSDTIQAGDVQALTCSDTKLLCGPAECENVLTRFQCRKTCGLPPCAPLPWMSDAEPLDDAVIGYAGDSDDDWKQDEAQLFYRINTESAGTDEAEASRESDRMSRESSGEGNEETRGEVDSVTKYFTIYSRAPTEEAEGESIKDFLEELDEAAETNPAHASEAPHASDDFVTEEEGRIHALEGLLEGEGKHVADSSEISHGVDASSIGNEEHIEEFLEPFDEGEDINAASSNEDSHVAVSSNAEDGVDMKASRDPSDEADDRETITSGQASPWTRATGMEERTMGLSRTVSDEGQESNGVSSGEVSRGVGPSSIAGSQLEGDGERSDDEGLLRQKGCWAWFLKPKRAEVEGPRVVSVAESSKALAAAVSTDSSARASTDEEVVDSSSDGIAGRVSHRARPLPSTRVPTEASISSGDSERSLEHAVSSNGTGGVETRMRPPRRDIDDTICSLLRVGAWKCLASEGGCKCYFNTIQEKRRFFPDDNASLEVWKSERRYVFPATKCECHSNEASTGPDGDRMFVCDFAAS